MNTRKASLRKLRLPGAIGNKARNGHQKGTETISHYFANEEHAENEVREVEMTIYSSAAPSPISAIDTGETENAEKISFSLTENHVEVVNAVETTTYSGQMPSPIEIDDQATDKPKRALRTKLSTFLPKEKRLKSGKINTHDFETPKKVIKKAPKAKSKATSKKQQNIKTAFLKREELFSEVTVQHCLVDNVNPDEMQMAIALSRSEAEVSMTMEEVQQNEEKENGEKEGIREKLKQFGFRVAESEDYNLTAFKPTRKKTKWANKFTALTLRNPERQLGKVNQKIDKLMNSQFASEDLLENDGAARYSVKSEALGKFQPKDQHVIRSNVCETSNSMEFYVLSLFEPSRTRAGHLLKDVRRIAGRDASPKKAGPVFKENDVHLQSPVTKRSRCNEVISSSCPFPSRDLVNLFDMAVKESEILHESSLSCSRIEVLREVIETVQERSLSCSGIEALREVTSTSLNVMEMETKEDNLSEEHKMICHTPRNVASNEGNVSVSVETTMSKETHNTSSPPRCTSPDIFADSDSDVAQDECADVGKQLNVSKSSSSEHHITTYEIFSSDEVKTFSVTKEDEVLSPTAVIDLTQCGIDTNSQPSQKDVKQGEEYRETSIEPPRTSLMLDSKEGEVNDDLKTVKSSEISFLGHQSLEKLGGISFGSSVSEEFNKSNSIKMTTSEVSIDLTQNDDEEDDCILLSDDEVNYSMWQAKRTEQTHLNASVDHVLNEKNESVSEKHEFSFVELVAGSQSLPPTQSEEFDKGLDQKSNSSLNLGFDLDHSKRSEFGILEEHSPFQTPTKTPSHTPKTTLTSKSPKEAFLTSPVRSAFELLDKQSPFKTPTKTPKKTPRKTPSSASAKCRTDLSNSFKSTASYPENATKPCSSTHSSNNDSDLDLDFSKRSDFGILDEQSPFKTPTGTPKKTPRKTPSSASPRCRKALSESFILSPGERVTPVKRVSSINKFTEFTKCENDGEHLSDLDEIDKLIYGSPSKNAYKKPAGLDQLLNGPINTEPDSPQKVHPDSPREFEFNGRTYLVRTSNVSQMLDYESMDEATLLNLLYKYGIRRLKRKQAVKVLEYIYKQTHPCLVEANESPIKQTQATSEDENVEEEENGGVPNEFKFNLKDCWGHLLVSDASVYMEIEDEQYIVQTNTSKKISTALLPFHIAWHNLVKSNKELHEAILHYEPIDLQEIYLFFKRLGYRYDPKELKYFFDSRSIIFRYDLSKGNPSAGTNRHTRKRPFKAARPAKGRTKLG